MAKQNSNFNFDDFLRSIASILPMPFNMILGIGEHMRLQGEFRGDKKAFAAEVRALAGDYENRVSKGTRELAQGQAAERGFLDQFNQQMQGQAGAMGQQANNFYGGRMQFADQFQQGLAGAGKGYNALPGQALNMFQQGSQGVNQGLQGLEGNINRIMGDRLNRNLGYLDESGLQERKDIEGRYANRLSQTQADLQQRGLGGSTIMAGLNQANARGLTGELGRLTERLNQQRLGVDIGLSGEAAAARERLGLNRVGALERQNTFGTGMFADLSSQGLAARERMAGNMFNARAMLSGDQGQAMMAAQNRLWGTGMSIGGMQAGMYARQPGQMFNAYAGLSGDALGFRGNMLQQPVPPGSLDEWSRYWGKQGSPWG